VADRGGAKQDPNIVETGEIDSPGLRSGREELAKVPNRFRVVSRWLAAATVAFFWIAGANAAAVVGDDATQAATQAAQSKLPATPGPAIGDAWDTVLKDTAPQIAPDPVLLVARSAYEGAPASDFINHFVMDGRTEFLHSQTYFTGLPTAGGVINVPPGSVSNPTGIPYPQAFQSSTNSMYSFVNWGTRGWLSDRVNSNFTFAYATDVTHTNDASPQLDFVNTFNSNRRAELVSGYIDIHSRPTDGILAGSSLRLGRQDVYGAELAEMDGASFTMDRPKYSWAVYGGRRFTYFSDPDQRAVGGANVLFRFAKSSTFEWDTFYYIRGTNLFRYKQNVGSSWLVSAALRMVGGYATDFNADAFWSPTNGKTSLRLSFAQKITDKDYFYDYTYNARDFDPHNPLLRLNLEALHPHTQFVIDASREITSRVRVGGALWVRRLNDSLDTGPFDTSFQDFRGHFQVFPWNKTDILVEYHGRDSNDRNTGAVPTLFDDLSTTGETRVQDVSLEFGRSFMDGRLNLRGGGFYRNLNFRDQFTVITGARDKGVIGKASFILDTKTRIFMDYDLDTDYPVFRPSIQNSQTFRFGVAWKY
jgi:hypothetical protein